MIDLTDHCCCPLDYSGQSVVHDNINENFDVCPPAQAEHNVSTLQMAAVCVTSVFHLKPAAVPHHTVHASPIYKKVPQCRAHSLSFECALRHMISSNDHSTVKKIIHCVAFKYRI